MSFVEIVLRCDWGSESDVEESVATAVPGVDAVSGSSVIRGADSITASAAS